MTSYGASKRLRSEINGVQTTIITQIENGEIDNIKPWQAGVHTIEVPESTTSYWAQKLENPNSGISQYYRSTASSPQATSVYFQNENTGLDDGDGTGFNSYGLRVGVKSDGTGIITNYGTDRKLQICKSADANRTWQDPMMTFNGDGTVEVEDGHTFCGATNTEIGYLNNVSSNIQTQLNNKLEDGETINGARSYEMAQLSGISTTSSIQDQLDAKIPLQSGEHTITIPNNNNTYIQFLENPTSGLYKYLRATSTTGNYNVAHYYQNNATGFSDADGSKIGKYGLKVGVDWPGNAKICMFGSTTNLSICTSDDTDRNEDKVMTFNGDGSVIMEDGHTFCGATNDEIGYLTGLTGNVENRLSLSGVTVLNADLIWSDSLGWDDTSNTFVDTNLNFNEGTGGTVYIAPTSQEIVALSVTIHQPTWSTTYHRLNFQFWIRGELCTSTSYNVGITDTSQHIAYVAQYDNMYTNGYSTDVQNGTFLVPFKLNQNDTLRIRVTELSQGLGLAEIGSGTKVSFQFLLK